MCKLITNSKKTDGGVGVGDGVKDNCHKVLIIQEKWDSLRVDYIKSNTTKAVPK